jgi:hypothetical protein
MLPSYKLLLQFICISPAPVETNVFQFGFLSDTVNILIFIVGRHPLFNKPVLCFYDSLKSCGVIPCIQLLALKLVTFNVSINKLLILAIFLFDFRPKIGSSIYKTFSYKSH